MAKPILCVVLEGGLVQSVVSNDPAWIGVEVMILDYDVEGVDNDSPNLIVMDEETEHAAYVRTDMVEPASIDLPAIYERLSAQEEAFAARGDA